MDDEAHSRTTMPELLAVFQDLLPGGMNLNGIADDPSGIRRKVRILACHKLAMAL